MIIESSGIVVDEDIRGTGLIGKRLNIIEDKIEQAVKRFEGDIFYSTDYDTLRMIRNSNILQSRLMYPLAESVGNESSEILTTVVAPLQLIGCTVQITREYRLLATLFNRALIAGHGIKSMYIGKYKQDAFDALVTIGSKELSFSSSDKKAYYFTEDSLTERTVAKISDILWQRRSVITMAEGGKLEIKTGSCEDSKRITYEVNRSIGILLERIA